MYVCVYLYALNSNNSVFTHIDRETIHAVLFLNLALTLCVNYFSQQR